MSIVRTSISYPQEMQAQLVALAKEDARSLSGYIQKVLREHLLSQGVTADSKEEKLKSVKRKVVRRKKKS